MSTPTRKMMRYFYRPWYTRPFAWLLLLLPVVVVGRVALTPWLAWQTRQSLARVPGYDIRFQKLDLFTFPPALLLRGVTVARQTVAGPAPVFSSERVEIHVAPLALLRHERHVEVRLTRPRLVVGVAEGDAFAAIGAALPPVHLDTVVVEEGRLEREGGSAGPPGLDRIQARLTGLVSQPTLATGRPEDRVTVEAGAGFLGSGQVYLRVSVDPWRAGPTLRGDLEMRNLTVGDLGRALPVAAFSAEPRGAFEVTARFDSDAGALKGRIDARTSAIEPGVDPRTLLAGLATTFTPVASGVKLTLTRTATVAPLARSGTLAGEVASPRSGSVAAVTDLVEVVLAQGLALGIEPLLEAQMIATE